MNMYSTHIQSAEEKLQTLKYKFPTEFAVDFSESNVVGGDTLDDALLQVPTIDARQNYS